MLIGKSAAKKKKQLCMFFGMPDFEVYPNIDKIKSKGIGSYIASSQLSFCGLSVSRQGKRDKMVSQLSKTCERLEKEILDFEKQLRQLNKTDARIIFNNARAERQAIRQKMEKSAALKAHHSRQKQKDDIDGISVSDTLSFALQIEQDLIATAIEVAYHDEIAARKQKKLATMIQEPQVLMGEPSNSSQDAADVVVQELLDRGIINSADFKGYLEKGSGMSLSKDQVINKLECDVAYSVQYPIKSGLVRQGLLLVGVAKGIKDKTLNDKTVIWVPQEVYIDNCRITHPCF
jgi:hypothetical protein